MGKGWRESRQDKGTEHLQGLLLGGKGLLELLGAHRLLRESLRRLHTGAVWDRGVHVCVGAVLQASAWSAQCPPVMHFCCDTGQHVYRA